MPSASNEECDHVNDLWFGTTTGKYAIMAVINIGNSHEIPNGIIFSFPSQISGKGKWIVPKGQY